MAPFSRIYSTSIGLGLRTLKTLPLSCSIPRFETFWHVGKLGVRRQPLDARGMPSGFVDILSLYRLSSASNSRFLHDEPACCLVPFFMLLYHSLPSRYRWSGDCDQCFFADCNICRGKCIGSRFLLVIIPLLHKACTISHPSCCNYITNLQGKIGGYSVNNSHFKVAPLLARLGYGHFKPSLQL